MKNLLSCTLLFILGNVRGQIPPEFKTDFLLPFVGMAQLSAETPLKHSKLGLEIDFRYWWKLEGYYLDETCPGCYEPSVEHLKSIIANITLKYYFLSKIEHTGFFFGIYARTDRLLSRIENKNKKLLIPYYANGTGAFTETAGLRTAGGVMTGYKILFWKRWIAEADLGFDVPFSKPLNRRDGFDIHCIISLKAGYRFY